MWQTSKQKDPLSGDTNEIAHLVKQEDIANIIDHSLLRPDATYADLKGCCEEAERFSFYSICVHPGFVRKAKDFLKGTDVRITSVIGFPLGMSLTEVKVYEAMNASLDGADEIDMVINIGALRSGDWKTVRKDVAAVVMATKGLIHKIIVETCYLDNSEKTKVIKIALDAGAEFIKTSTGFGPVGAKTEDVRLIKSIVGDAAGIKAAGGIRTLAQVLDMIKAGATRIGTSAGVKILKELEKNTGGTMSSKNINVKRERASEGRRNIERKD
jgi:deoxyribose-phosphate aldolase